jgi:CheY-like chemotaxis protein
MNATLRALPFGPRPRTIAGWRRTATDAARCSWSPTITEVLSRYLERAGHEARAAADGPQALELAGRRRPDLVILDLLLPGLDGLE